MEKEIVTFQAELERYEAKTNCCHSNWVSGPRFLYHEGSRYWLENRIKNNNKMIAELQLLLNKLHEQKEALMEDIKRYRPAAIPAKEDADCLMLKLKSEMWDLDDDIVRARKKCIDKKRQMFYDKLDLKDAIADSRFRSMLTSTSNADIEAKKARKPPQNEDDSDEAKCRVVFDETEPDETEEDEAESDNVKSIVAEEETDVDEIDTDAEKDQDECEEIF